LFNCLPLLLAQKLLPGFALAVEFSLHKTLADVFTRKTNPKTIAATLLTTTFLGLDLSKRHNIKVCVALLLDFILLVVHKTPLPVMAPFLWTPIKLNFMLRETPL
jgi:hypothetical protein